jgi:hypothetical protein
MVRARNLRPSCFDVVRADLRTSEPRHWNLIHHTLEPVRAIQTGHGKHPELTRLGGDLARLVPETTDTREPEVRNGEGRPATWDLGSRRHGYKDRSGGTGMRWGWPGWGLSHLRSADTAPSSSAPAPMTGKRGAGAEGSIRFSYLKVRQGSRHALPPCLSLRPPRTPPT